MKQALPDANPMELFKDDEGWWITEIPGAIDHGPYGTKGEADDDRRGLWKSLKTEHIPGAWVTDERRKRKG